MKVREEAGVAPGDLSLDSLLEAQQPVVLKGLAANWSLVMRGRESAAAAIDYLKSFDGGRPVVGYTGSPEIGGRFFYNQDLTGLNFEAGRVPLHQFLDRIAAHLGEADGPSFYIGSTDLDLYLPGLRAKNDLGLDPACFGPVPPLVSIWIGNRTIASTHYDMSNNLACCMVGRRRFTLFPPDQVHNLYPGPLEPTPGGQVVSMVDLRAPDLETYPRFASALAAARVAELETGDVLFYPALWWHHVEALDDFNVMINYWWNPTPAFIDTPMNTLLHGLLSLRDRPEPEKRAWRALFDHYVFGPADRAAAHLPKHARGDLGPLDEAKARRLRALLLNRLNR
ncbi:cupin-like domain-containing protein [Sphingosinicella sp. CPCC 101087]|uniref:cupin-like domain-containing protein n=1 Tax=Sphingosinicella sp. CPCC 101087 TaxID=2497754 RepID=UPI00101DEACB|nr:cupin-like domain-containing protein [Sphingosinicella sp. CPCC 101087]